jgi:hypothetical protein
MTDRSKSAASEKQSAGDPESMAVIGEVLMKTILFSILAVLTMGGISAAKDLPSVVEKKPIDATFVSLAVISTGSTFADSYTTLFARQNWLAGKKGVCNMEVQSAYLYGTHPTVGRTYAIASAKSAASVLVAYYLRKHHNKFWSMPLVANSIVSLQGVTQNMMACN